MSEFHTASPCRNCDGKTGFALIYHFDWLLKIVTHPEGQPYPIGWGLPMSTAIHCNCELGRDKAAFEVAIRKRDEKGNEELSYEYDEDGQIKRKVCLGDRWYHIPFDSYVTIEDVLQKFSSAIDSIENENERNYYANKFGFIKETANV